jgi:glycosyltransferase involved in cell wall biosynthesis
MKKLHTFVVLAYKESEYLEECIKSTLNQKYKSDVIIATSTPNKFITDLANKYSLKVYENKGPKGIGNDFDFGIKCASTPLVTIAHQDDIYDYEFSYYVVEEYNEHKGVIILFTDYYEIRNDFKQYINRNLIIKRILLTPIRLHSTSGLKINKRLILALGILFY